MPAPLNVSHGDLEYIARILAIATSLGQPSDRPWDPPTEAEYHGYLRAWFFASVEALAAEAPSFQEWEQRAALGFVESYRRPGAVTLDKAEGSVA